MADKPDVDLERANKALDELFRAHYSGEEAKSFRHALRRNFAPALAAEFRAVRRDQQEKIRVGLIVPESLAIDVVAISLAGLNDSIEHTRMAVCNEIELWIEKRLAELEASK